MKAISMLIQGVALLCILLASPGEDRTEQKFSQAKAILTWNGGQANTIREASEVLSLQSSIQASLVAKLALYSELTLLREVKSNPSLHIAPHQFHPFYFLPTIHAP